MNKLLLFIALLICCTAMAKPRCHVQGMIESSYTGYIRIVLDGPKIEENFSANIPVTGGHIDSTFTIPYYGMYGVMKDSDYTTRASIVIDSSAIWICRHTGDTTYIWGSGSSAMNAYIPLNDFYNEERKAAGNYLRAKIKTPNDTATHKIMGEAMGAISIKRRQAEIAFMHSYPNSVASAYKLTWFSMDYEPDTVKKLYATLGKAARNSPYGKKISDNINHITEFAVGKPAPKIQGKDTSGIVHKLSDYRGKYVLLDFTASGCVPCRIQAPVLRQVNREYGDRVQILSVSMDKNRTDWTGSISRDSMAWANISDMGGLAGKAAKTYKIEGVPTIYLIGPDGRIAARKLYEKSIYTAVKKEMDKKK
jgi:thiol-disulfide isomerase/thioredoxin